MYRVEIRFESITGQFLVVPHLDEKPILHMISYHNTRESAEREANTVRTMFKIN
jgi:hypothetical protein